MNHDLDHGRYHDGRSPYDPCWAGGLGGLGPRDGAGAMPARSKSEPVAADAREDHFSRCGNWGFPLGSSGFLF